VARERERVEKKWEKCVVFSKFRRKKKYLGQACERDRVCIRAIRGERGRIKCLTCNMLFLNSYKKIM
jgi:hypothetical protein